MIIDFQEARDKFESDFIKDILIKTGGNVAKASILSNIPLRTLFTKLRKHALGRYAPIDTKSWCKCASIPDGKIQWDVGLNGFYCSLCKKVTNPKYDNYYTKTLEQTS